MIIFQNKSNEQKEKKYIEKYKIFNYGKPYLYDNL